MAAGSHQPGGQVLLSGTVAAFNELRALVVESPHGGSAQGNKAGDLQEGSEASATH